MVHLDVAFIFDKAGGPRGLLSLLDKHVGNDRELNYTTVQMWKHRDRIAGDWIPAVLYALLREGVPALACFVDDREFREG